MRRRDLSIVIPFYNDKGCAKPFVTELKKELSGIDYELILVDDCSTDSTPQELGGLSGERVQVIHNEHNRDYGGAVMAGLEMARGDTLCFTNGDGKVTPKSVVAAYKNMNHREVGKAIRKGRKDGPIRWSISSGFNILAEIRFRTGLHDINGYPVFMKREVLESLRDLREDWLFNLDLYRKIMGQNHEIWEFPVEHEKRRIGKSHMSLKRMVKLIPKFFSYR